MPRERSITRWLREKWALLTGDRLYILNHLSVASTSLYATAVQLPYQTLLYARPPQSLAGPWEYEWRWITPPIRGVTFGPENSAYTQLTFASNAEVGKLARLECVGRCEGKEYRSAPFAVQVLPVDNNV